LLDGATKQVLEKNSKYKKLGAKFVLTTLAVYKQTERKILPQYFTQCIVDVHPCKNILLAPEATEKSHVCRGHANKRTALPPIVLTKMILSSAL